MSRLEEINKEIASVKEQLENVKGSPCEVYARIVGYYRAVSNWNKGKREEYGKRKVFVEDKEAVAGRMPAEESA